MVTVIYVTLISQHYLTDIIVPIYMRTGAQNHYVFKSQNK